MWYIVDNDSNITVTYYIIHSSIKIMMNYTTNLLLYNIVL